MSKFSDAIGETYKVIRNYLPGSEATSYGKQLISHVDKTGSPTTADIVKNAFDEYNYPEHVAILTEKVSELNYMLGEKVLPTYCFSRVYKNKADLEKHIDRDSCEVSLSIHLYGDSEWTFWIKNLNGEDIGVVLNPGDAILYDGPNAEHWRNEYEGENYAQLFTHYVYLNGEHKNNYFDNVDQGMSLMSGVKRYDNFVPVELCNKIIEKSSDPKHSGDWVEQETVGKTKNQRVCEGFSLNIFPELDTELFGYINSAISKYCSETKHLMIQQDSGYTILRYSKGGKYVEHVDHSMENNRALTIIVNLNDDYSGGELHHFGGKLKNALGKGDVVVFPANFQYPHAITPITSGNRYSIVTWAV